jgi:hypothetical protein
LQKKGQLFVFWTGIFWSPNSRDALIELSRLLCSGDGLFRRYIRAPAAAVDVMAASPIVSATSLAASLSMAVKNAAALLDAFVERGIAIEVTHRAKRRLYGLKHLAPLREEAAPPRRPMSGR